MTEDIMAGNRWENLDFEPPRSAKGASAPVPLSGTEAASHDEAAADPHGLAEPPPPSNSAIAPAEVLCPVVLQAQGAYFLRDYQAAVDHLEGPLLRDACLAGGQRLLGQALARLNREPEAVERLAEAVRQSGSDWLARSSLASLLLRSPAPPSSALPPEAGSAGRLLVEALGHAPEMSRPAVRELLGAAYWQEGQECLRLAPGREAERRFGAAATEFARAADESASARRELPPRQSAALVGQAVALIVGGAPEAAQRLFSLSRLPPAPPTDSLCRFAAGLYELCEELTFLPADERSPVVEALRDVVLQTRLEVAFYDGRAAVSLCWWAGAP
jgi:hypothetical protein